MVMTDRAQRRWAHYIAAMCRGIKQPIPDGATRRTDLVSTNLLLAGHRFDEADAEAIAQYLVRV